MGDVSIFKVGRSWEQSSKCPCFVFSPRCQIPKCVRSVSYVINFARFVSIQKPVHKLQPDLRAFGVLALVYMGCI